MDDKNPVIENPERGTAAPPPPFPDAETARKAKGGRKAKNASAETSGAPPWPNFNQTATHEQQLEARQAARLMPTEGMKRYFCRRNCSNGKYVAGRDYRLPADHPLANNEKFFKKLG